MRYLTKKQLRDRICLSPTQVSRLEEVNKFPLRVRVGFRVFWIEEEVNEWMLARADERNARLPKSGGKSSN
jgi:predicted DNA-binding transcriptional regulator AlpA